MFRAVRPWPLVLPLAALGTLAAHALAYRAVGTTGDGLHEYLGHLPGLSLLLLVLGLLGASLVERETRVRAWPFPAVAVGAFVGQEHLERLAHDGALPLLFAEPVFLIGLLLQLPVAVAVWLVALVLLRTVGRPRRDQAVPSSRPGVFNARPDTELAVAPAGSRSRPRAPPAAA